MSVDIWQMFCSISRPNNSGQQYFLSGSVGYGYINPIRCDRGFTLMAGELQLTSWPSISGVTGINIATCAEMVVEAGPNNSYKT